MFMSKSKCILRFMVWQNVGGILYRFFIKYRLPPIFYILALINAERNCYEETATLARDNYTLDNGKISLKSAERMMNDGNTLIQFTPEELSVLQSFGEDSVKDTTDHLRIIAPLIKDEPSRNLALRTADKIDLLPEHSYKELFSTTQRRYEMQNNLSIRTKIDRARERAKSLNKGQKVQKKGDIAL